MSRILAIILCLIITFWSIPQNNSVSADIPKCSDNFKVTIGYNNQNNFYKTSETNPILPVSTDAIFFEVTGPFQQGWQYFAAIDGDNNRHTDIATPNGTALSGYLSITKDYNTNPFKRGQHNVQLWREKGNDKQVECQGIQYQIGRIYSTKDCQLKLSTDDLNRSPYTSEAITAIVSRAPHDSEYNILYTANPEFVDKNKPYDKKVKTDADGNGSFQFTTNNTAVSNAGISLYYTTMGGSTIFCEKKFNITPAPVVPPDQPAPNTQPQCTIFPDKNDLDIFKDIDVKVTNVDPGNRYYAKVVNKTSGETVSDKSLFTSLRDKTVTVWLNKRPAKLAAGDYSFEIYHENNNLVCSAQDFTVKGDIAPKAPVVKKCGEEDDKGKVIECSKGGGKDAPGCNDKEVPDPNDSTKKIPNPNPGIATAIGCIHTSPAEFTKDLLKFIIGIGGGLAFLMMLLGTYQMLSSGGNPESLKAGQDRLTSAVIGLLFIIFSILLLQIIGVGILNIPGFGK